MKAKCSSWRKVVRPYAHYVRNCGRAHQVHVESGRHTGSPGIIIGVMDLNKVLRTKRAKAKTISAAKREAMTWYQDRLK